MHQLGDYGLDQPPEGWREGTYGSHVWLMLQKFINSIIGGPGAWGTREGLAIGLEVLLGMEEVDVMTPGMAIGGICKVGRKKGHFTCQLVLLMNALVISSIMN